MVKNLSVLLNCFLEIAAMLLQDGVSRHDRKPQQQRMCDIFL